MKSFDKSKTAVKGTAKPETALVDEVYAMFDEYREKYQNEWQRMNACEKTYMGKHWEDIGTEAGEPAPVTNVVQSTVENISADLMDNFPEAIVMPETPDDEGIAMVVEQIVKQNHDASAYIKDYKKLAHDLLVCGYMVQEVGYDTTLNNGIGGAFVRHVAANNIMVDPMAMDIQDGRAVIKFTGIPKKTLDKRYPEHAPFASDRYAVEGETVAKDPVFVRDMDEMAVLIEYWNREFDPDTQRYSVHMCKIACGKLLEDSRGVKPEGYYAHGKYPFVVTPLFERKGSPLGMGLVDMYGERQKTADKMDQIILKNAFMASHVKMLVSNASGFDERDLRDWRKEVHVGESLNGIKWFETPPLPPYIFQYVESMRQDIKDESGSNDFSRGTTGGGVTAASAIAALQEASGKRSRMAGRQMHEAFKEAVRLEIETEREFNILPRKVVVTRDGQQQVLTFESELMNRQTERGNNEPIEFFVSIKVQRENRWTVMAHNELILQMMQLEAITREQALELMQFEGKESVLKHSKEQANPEAVAQQQMQSEIGGLPPPDIMAAEQMM